MTTIDIQSGDQEIKDFNIITIEMLKIRLNSLSVINELLQGTDSDEWLIESEAQEAQ